MNLKFKPTLEGLSNRYAKDFQITTNQGWMRIYSNQPIIRRGRGKFHLDYSLNIEPDDGKSLYTRTRNISLRDSQGIGVQSVSYVYGMGIWQVIEDAAPRAFYDLYEKSQRMVTNWLHEIDNLLLKYIPELKHIGRQK